MGIARTGCVAAAVEAALGRDEIGAAARAVAAEIATMPSPEDVALTLEELAFGH